ncbi:MAG TPA: hypothetical protein VN886_07845 [Acidimicrobiales bacterium]|nr:hypothetical protein [Acidimicrobiales bacterium]
MSNDALGLVGRPATVVHQLESRIIRSLLAEPASGRRDLCHGSLHDLPASKPVEHLLVVMVATGALPGHDEHLSRIER